MLRRLPTIGGPNGFATGSNDSGQVVGWVQDKVHDPTCDSRQMLQFRAIRPWAASLSRLSSGPGMAHRQRETAC